MKTYSIGWEAESLGEESYIEAENLQQAQEISRERLLECVNSWAIPYKFSAKTPVKSIDTQGTKK